MCSCVAAVLDRRKHLRPNFIRKMKSMQQQQIPNDDYQLQLQTAFEGRQLVGKELDQLISRYAGQLGNEVDDWSKLLSDMDNQIRFMKENIGSVTGPERFEVHKLEEQTKLEERLLKGVESCETEGDNDDQIQSSQTDLLVSIEKHARTKHDRIHDSTNSRVTKSQNLRQLVHLLGGRVKSETDTSCVVELAFATPSSLLDEVPVASGDQTTLTLDVEITFRNVRQSRHIAAVKTSGPALDIDDIVAEAKRCHNVPWMLSCIYDRWKRYCSIFTEVEQLRQRYALDWLHAEGIIRILYGGPTSATCTLKLGDSYPDGATARAVLQSASGLPAGLALQDLQIPATISSLSAALDFLKNKLAPNSASNQNI